MFIWFSTYFILVFSLVVFAKPHSFLHPTNPTMSSLSAPPSSNSSHSNEERIQTVTNEIQSAFEEWTNAWNNHDIDGYLDGYADIPSVRYVSGKQVTRGKHNIVKLFQTRGARGFLSVVHFELESISDLDAVCFGQYHLVEKSDSATAKSGDSLESDENVHEGCFTVHVRKIKGSWKIVSDHSS